MDFDDNKWKVYKSQYLTGEERYWLVYKQNDFGDPMWICGTFEEAWDKLYISIGWKKKVTPVQDMARKLHKNFCNLSHTDQCSWQYEEANWNMPTVHYSSVWEAPTHKRWLEKARDLTTT